MRKLDAEKGLMTSETRSVAGPGPAWLSIDGSHRARLRQVLVLLAVLAMAQFMAWLLPATPGSKGIPYYLPWHALMEAMSIIVSMMVFAVGWNSRDSRSAGTLALLACAFFTVALLDFCHTEAYVGMPDFFGHNDSEKHLNFWLAARLVAALALLGVALRPWNQHISRAQKYLLLSLLLAAVLVWNEVVIEHQDLLPHLFIPGQGLTPLKIDLEYLFIAINLATALLLWRSMRQPQSFNAALLFGAACTMAMSELFFTLYTTMTGAYNVLGHIYKVISYLFIYRAVVVEAVERPYLDLADAQRNLTLAVKASNTGLWDWDMGSGRAQYSEVWRQQLGYRPDELSNDIATWERLLHPEDRAQVLNRLREFLETQDQIVYESEFRLRHRDGSYHWMLARGEKQQDAQGLAKRLIGANTDLTERKKAEQRIEELVNYDALTGLPNRHLLADRARRAISAAQREHSHIALLFLDLDHFKHVNDSLGHRVGDLLLCEVGKRMRSVLRDVDTVSRNSGDEFVVIMTHAEVDGVARVAAKLCRAIAQPFHVEQLELAITPSIGIALFPEDGSSFDALYQHADTAMYAAKRDGRNDYRFYTAEMQQQSERTLALEAALHHALHRKQMRLVYQPQLTLTDQRVVGFEALLRWTHPVLGEVSPAEFIPIAEGAGHILAIGNWVLRTALDQLRQWRDAGQAPMVMAVNLSAAQFRHADLSRQVAEALENCGLPHECLELELTESLAMTQPAEAVATLDALHAQGVRLAIDDFGTGYSSLSYLKRFQVQRLKIDQSFVRDIVSDADDRGIVQAIIQMAHTLGFGTIAEGVETQEQLDFLREQGCDEVQGYFFARPLPPEDLPAFVARQNGLSPATVS